jgi:hypothetical protein
MKEPRGMSKQRSDSTNGLAATVVMEGGELATEIHDSREGTLSLFGPLTDAQREQLALDAWLVGSRALANAHAQAQEARLQDVGRALLQDFERQLRDHVEAQQRTVTTVLGRFFDPHDGQVTQRLAAFVDDQGVLAQLLERHLAPKNSMLAEALALQVGESSPLFKKLNPDDSQGVVKTMEGELRRVMGEEHQELVRALDPLAKDGAVARFLDSLREELKGADADRAAQLATALAALDTNDEDSLINRLARDTERAQQAVLQAMNPSVPGSPMAVISETLTRLLKDHSTLQENRLREQAERQAQFEKEVREALTRIESRRAQELKSPRGGLDFEDAVVRSVAAMVAGAPCVVEDTSKTPGMRPRSKKGDLVVRFTEESAFAGAAVVFEAKREAGFSVQDALNELDEARKNRNAAVGVLVMAKSHASDTFPRLARYGNNVLVVWDESDPGTDIYLHAAILLGLGLVARGRTVGDQGDIEALRDVEGRIESEVSRLARLASLNENIRSSSEKIDEELRKAQKQLETLLKKSRSMLKALNVELSEEAVECSSPIGLDAASLSRGRAALGPIAPAEAPVEEAAREEKMGSADRGEGP